MHTTSLNWTDRIISLASGAMLVKHSFRHKFAPVWAISGCYLLYRGFAGKGLFNGITQYMEHQPPAVNIRSEFTINKPRQELYAYWRNLENLPLFLKHLVSVKEHGHNRSTWTAKFPGYPATVTWDTEIVKDEPNVLIGWQSLANTFISNAGKVTFSDAPDGQNTQVNIVFSYRPPLGALGRDIAKALNPTFQELIEKEMAGFKKMMEQEAPPIATIKDAHHA